MREIDIWCVVFDAKGFVADTNLKTIEKFLLGVDGYLEFHNPELYTGFNFEVYFNTSTGEVSSVFVNDVNIKSAFYMANKDIFRNVKLSQIVLEANEK